MVLKKDRPVQVVSEDDAGSALVSAQYAARRAVSAARLERDCAARRAGHRHSDWACDRGDDSHLHDGSRVHNRRGGAGGRDEGYGRRDCVER